MAAKRRQKPIDSALHPAQLRAIARKAMNKAGIALAKASRYYKEADKREAVAMDAKIDPAWEVEFCKTCKSGKDCKLHPKEET